jgi:hypothetical protein
MLRRPRSVHQRPRLEFARECARVSSFGLSGCREVCEHREDAAIGVVGFGNVEFHEDVPYVSFDRSLAQVEALCDAGVCEAFCHQLENFALAHR